MDFQIDISLHAGRNNSISDRGQRRSSQRKDSTDRYEANENGNNSNEVSRRLESYISNYTKSAGGSHRPNSNRAPGGLRMKSNLVGSMKATFEQLKVKDSLPPPGTPALKSPSYSRVEAATTFGQKTANPTNKAENGLDHSSKGTVANTPKHENGIAPNEDIDDTEPTPSQRAAKPSSSARRGKQQREKRMLRQKRRSTGVVRLKGSDDEEEKSAEKTNSPEEKENETRRKAETEKNTVSNELSPPPSASRVRAEVENKSRPHDTPYSSHTQVSSNSSSTLLSPTQPDNVFLSADSSPQSPSFPSLNSSRRRGKRVSDLSQQDANDKNEIEELRRKLAAAETTIGNLTKDVDDMEEDIKRLAEENHKLKHENKLLEDENASMLMVLKQLRNSRE